MISPSTAALGVSIARGILKIGRHADLLLAEKKAVEGALVLPQPPQYAGPSGSAKVEHLKELLRDPSARQVIGSSHDALVATLAGGNPDMELVHRCYERAFPERLEIPPFNPDEQYVRDLRAALPDVDFDNPDTFAAAFTITAHDQRELKIPARIGLLVVDVLAEFGAENASLFVRDPKLRSVVQSVLVRFSKPELGTFTKWSPLLRHALAATLNGALDARGVLVDGTDQWVASLLDALAAAREKAGDDFILGLIQGRGYPLLISEGLSRAAKHLGADESDTVRQLAADVLAAAAPLVAQSPSFGRFFADHWGDLLRAGLAGLEKHGPALLGDESKLLSDIVVAMAKELQQVRRPDLLTSDTLFRLGDAVIGAVAANEALLAEKIGGEPWLRVLLGSVTRTLAREGIATSVTQEGLTRIVADAAQVFAAHPELILRKENAELPHRVLKGILESVATVGALDARVLAQAAVSGTLTALAENPQLIGTRHPALVAALTGELARLVKERRLNALNATTLLQSALAVMERNPELLVDAAAELPVGALQAVMAAVGTAAGKPLSGKLLNATYVAVLASLARYGMPKLQNATKADASAALTETVTAAVRLAAAEVGVSADLHIVPGMVGALVSAWASGQVPDFNVNSDQLKKLVTAILVKAIESNSARSP